MCLQKYGIYIYCFIPSVSAVLLMLIDESDVPAKNDHYGDVIMSAMASQITGVSILYSTVCSGADQRKDATA